MLRIILGVIAGFIAWSILWVGSDQLFHTMSSTWYGAQKNAMELAVANGEPYRADAAIYILDLVRSGIASIMAGFIAAIVALENRRSPVILGIILLIVGIMVQVSYWNVFPVWFQVTFWLMLIPLTILGGKMKQSTQ